MSTFAETSVTTQQHSLVSLATSVGNYIELQSNTTVSYYRYKELLWEPLAWTRRQFLAIQPYLFPSVSHTPPAISKELDSIEIFNINILTNDNLEGRGGIWLFSLSWNTFYIHCPPQLGWTWNYLLSFRGGIRDFRNFRGGPWDCQKPQGRFLKLSLKKILKVINVASWPKKKKKDKKA